MKKIWSMTVQSSILATDLDGTFIPLAGNDQNIADLKLIEKIIQDRDMVLCYVTGRHFESIKSAITQFHLPTPHWIICDVGTTIRRESGGTFELLEDYRTHLETIISEFPIAALKELLLQHQELREQEHEKQGEFKLSYYIDQTLLLETTHKIQNDITQKKLPYSIIASVDPFNGDGLIDLLPRDSSKAYALNWWTKSIGCEKDAIIFAGDSGNDLAAMVSGYRTIVVANASQNLYERVQAVHAAQDWRHRLFRSREPATSGVLEGLNHFGASLQY